MTQNSPDVEIANQGFAAFRQDLNDVLEDITTLHSGTAAPSTTYANQWWYETDTNKLYIRNEVNDAWIEILTLDQANDHLATIGASITLDGTGNVSIDSGDFTVDTDTLHVDSTNNRVGIGTSSSLEGTLHVESISNNNIIMDAPANRFNSIGFQTAGADKWWLGRADSDQISGDAFFIGNDNGNATDAGGLSNKLVINQSGNVGIGTSSPSVPLEVNVSGASDVFKLMRDTGTNGELNIDFNGANTNLNCETGGFSFETSSRTQALNISPTGLVSINTAGGAQAGTGVAGTTIRYTDILKSTSTTGGANQIVFYNPNGSVGTITTTGSSTAYNTSSDYRLKEHVTGITDGIERVKQLNPSRFNFIADADKTVDGFLAHEAATVVPEAVSGEKDAMCDEEYEVTPAVYEDVVIPAVLDDDGNEIQAERTEQQLVTEAVMGTRAVPDYQGIDQAKLVPLLTAALQEAITKIEDLETRVAALEN